MNMYTTHFHLHVLTARGLSPLQLFDDGGCRAGEPGQAGERWSTLGEEGLWGESSVTVDRRVIPL